MPYIAGGIFKGDTAHHKTNLLCQQQLDLVDPCVITLESSQYSALLKFGFYEMESSQEMVSIAPDEKSFLCGRLFSKSTGEAVTISSLDVAAIKRTQGKELAQNYWGRYILLLLDDEGITFYRDPQGLSVLYYTHIDQGYLFVTNLSSLVDALPSEVTINWTYLTSFIASNHNITTVTPFNDIYELLPGCATTFKINASPEISQFWDPTTISSSYIEDEDSFQQKIFETAQMTLSSWVLGSNKVNIELSGGLDSSSLLALLKYGGYDCPVQALNFFNSSFAASDEKEFAQDVSDLYQVPVKFINSKELLPFGELHLSRRYDRPSSALLDTSVIRHVISAMNVSKDDEILSGQGGDHLFLAPPPREAYVRLYARSGIFS